MRTLAAALAAELAAIATAVAFGLGWVTPDPPGIMRPTPRAPVGATVILAGTGWAGVHCALGCWNVPLPAQRK